ncbi:MsnO8 family LLM class oxidoreductase [Pseudonocardia endophytica]|uniref:Luciferase family oxidoreductase group 1 n=1 Tax=Pseudonocardia endophytica TaxID=401976 RepID=A0A4R1HEV2_PSEEN|nr:MsnO8 family LLM class oxidoreductase [Pseudonocardia endophytica]TCK20148.1 luciferase family oxidoreductase group 1 [Pseudonocardia endophytica]
MRLSLLDRSRTRAGEPDPAALTRTVERAKRAERLGYHRFWVAEHHAVPGIASGAPTVLMAAVAAATERIRIGSGGIMLPNHQPLVVAEQVATLAALHPGRIDVGVGRTPAFTEPVRRALRSDGEDGWDDTAFAADLRELRSYLDGTGPVTVRPRPAEAPPLFVLATGAGLRVAGDLRLPVVVGGPVLDDRAALDGYRSRAGDDAYVVVSADVLIGDPELALPEAWALAAARTTGEFPPLEPPDPGRRTTERQRAVVDRALERTIVGDEDTVAERLDELVERTGADELLVTSSTWDGDALAESDARLAAVLSGVTGHVP